MRVAFHKMHGLGNDFVVLDERAGPLGLTPAAIARLADRRTGIGFDQLVLLSHAPAGDDVAVRFHNPDGSESATCGNASRCVAALIGGDVPGRTLRLRTAAGLLPARLLGGGRVEVGMGTPRLGWRDIPLAHDADTLHLPLPGDPAGCSLGNPHATVFEADPGQVSDPARDGPGLETDPLFPERANIGFATVLSRDRIRLVVWERGAGLTRACGSGACAAVVNAIRRGLADAPRRRRDAGRRARGRVGRRRRGPHDRAGHPLLHRRGRAGRPPLTEILTFGCRLDLRESGVMRDHAAFRDDRVITGAVTAAAEREACPAIRSAHRERPGARIAVTGRAAQLDPAATAPPWPASRPACLGQRVGDQREQPDVPGQYRGA